MWPIQVLAETSGILYSQHHRSNFVSYGTLALWAAHSDLLNLGRKFTLGALRHFGNRKENYPAEKSREIQHCGWLKTFVYQNIEVSEF